MADPLGEPRRPLQGGDARDVVHPGGEDLAEVARRVVEAPLGLGAAGRGLSIFFVFFGCLEVGKRGEKKPPS